MDSVNTLLPVHHRRSRHRSRKQYLHSRSSTLLYLPILPVSTSSISAAPAAGSSWRLLVHADLRAVVLLLCTGTGMVRTGTMVPVPVRV